MTARMTREEAHNQTGSAVMPAWLFYTPEIGASAKFVYMAVYNWPDEFPAFYAEQHDITEEAVRAGLNDLFNLGVIGVREGKPYPKPSVVEIEGFEE